MIFGVILFVGGKDGAQASLIEARVVCNEGDGIDFYVVIVVKYFTLYLFPYFWEVGSIVGVVGAQSVDFLTEGGIVVGRWVNERVVVVDYLAIAYHDDADAAYAGR